MSNVDRWRKLSGLIQSARALSQALAEKAAAEGDQLAAARQLGRVEGLRAAQDSLDLVMIEQSNSRIDATCEDDQQV